MKKNIKAILSIFGVGASIFLAIEIVHEWGKYTRQKAYDKAQWEEGVRMGNVRRELAQSLATCTADSINATYLDSFITHEIMPLGLAWQLANSGELNDLKTSLKLTASRRLSEYFRQYIDTFWEQKRDYEFQLSLKEPSIGHNASVKYPALLVYKSLSAGELKGKNPQDIEIGTKQVDWPQFIILAKRCKATPNDLKTMAGKESSNSSDSSNPDTEWMEYTSPDYVQMKHEFWKILSETQPFKDSLLQIKSRNADIIQGIIRQSEPLMREQERKKAAAEDMLFK